MNKPLKILFIEDSVEDVELVELELIRGGFAPNSKRVETLSDTQNALQEEDWELIISDYHMPQFSADHALQALLDSGKDIPFIILSGAVEADDAVNLLKHGAHDFLNKETLARLIPAVERELREADERAQRRKAEQRVRILSTAIQQSPVSVVITDKNGIINYVNPKFEEVTGYSITEALGRNLNFTLMDKDGEDSFEELWNTVSSGEEWRGEFSNVRRDGQLFWEYAKVSPLTDENGEITHYIAVKEDISVRRNYEEQLLHQAHFDDLTGLANRALMLDRLDIAIESAIRNKNNAALLCIDLDRFKNVNDTLGHSVGDNLLKEAATRLNRCIRKCDTLARIGGDEFIIILPKIDGESDIVHIAERIIDAFAEPFSIETQDHFVTASIGIVLFPEDGDDQQTLLRNADLAMYKAKELGRNRYQFFTEEINRKLKQSIKLEAQLRGSINRNELVLLYQPIIDLKSNSTVAFEALLRWHQSDGEIYMPAQFVPLAEDVGLIKEIGDWVITTACTEASHILNNSPAPIKLSVNVSPKQLQSKGFANYIKDQLLSNGLKPEHLELEITESVLIDDSPIVHINLKALCDLGVSLSIDDFGTGYSSLGYLQKYPFHTLKIDRSFISDAVNNSNSARLVETIITMGHSLGLEVIAEGVETAEQLSFLCTRANICNHVQGFLFGRPVPIAELTTIANEKFATIENLKSPLLRVK